jgi:nucleoid-associated protein YgaU
MKSYIRLVVAFFLMYSIFSVACAQDMTKNQWQQAMQEATQKRDALQLQVKGLEADIASLKTQDASLAQQLDSCQHDVMGLLGTTAGQEKEFAAFLDKIDMRLSDLSKLSNEDLYLRRAELDTVQSLIEKAKRDKLSLLPEYNLRITKEQNQLDMLRTSLKSAIAQEEQIYTVGTWSSNRDCLWNIAKKPKVYDNAFLWPKIWQDNRDQIKDPDIIHPGQELRIPTKNPLTAQEKNALRSYLQMKADYASSGHGIASPSN